METDCDEEVEFFESELDVCHALLDLAGPKPLTDLIAKARQGYENALQWTGTVHDPARLRRISAKLDRLRDRLAGCPDQVLSASMKLRAITIP